MLFPGSSLCYSLRHRYVIPWVIGVLLTGSSLCYSLCHRCVLPWVIAVLLTGSLLCYSLCHRCAIPWVIPTLILPERFSLKKNILKLMLHSDTLLQNIHDIDSLLYNVEPFSKLKQSTGHCVEALPLNVIHSSFPVASWFWGAATRHSDTSRNITCSSQY